MTTSNPAGGQNPPATISEFPPPARTLPAHSLAALAAEVLGADPFSGAVLVFRSRRANRIKLLLWDGSGLVMVWKQLEASAFRWPAIVDGVVRLTKSERLPDEQLLFAFEEIEATLAGRANFSIRLTMRTPSRITVQQDFSSILQVEEGSTSPRTMVVPDDRFELRWPGNGVLPNGWLRRLRRL